jgi:hypothetical protein
LGLGAQKSRYFPSTSQPLPRHVVISEQLYKEKERKKKFKMKNQNKYLKIWQIVIDKLDSRHGGNFIDRKTQPKEKF